jgi:AraC family transcriptional regulator
MSRSHDTPASTALPHPSFSKTHTSVRAQTVLFESDILRVRAVRCAAAPSGHGPIEWSAANTIVFPEAGVFVKHLGRHAAVVADRSHAVFFTADQPYRVSHPVPGGDDCLVLELRPAALADALHTNDPASAETPNAPFRRPAVRLPSNLILRRRLLHHRIVRRVASALEVEETAAELLRGSVRSAVERPLKTHRRGRDAVGQVDIAEAAQLTIASRPAARWTLATIARQIGCSPFHLAHVFRDVVGVSIHQYHIRARLAAALDDVLDSQCGLSAIAADAGFAHHSHFSHAFQRTFGVTPSVLRRDATASEITRLRRILIAR